MPRQDYDEIKNRFEQYIMTWKTKDRKVVEDIIDKFVMFSTSTSIRMANGAQNSVYGVFDFLNDFPQSDVLNMKIYNYVARICGNRAYGYAEVVCSAFTKKESLSFIEFVVFVQTTWEKNDVWKITNLRQETVYEDGDLKADFEKKWHFENKVGGRVQVVRGEADSPWLNAPEAEDVLTETEKVKETIYKNVYGEEHIVFSHCFETYSQDYNVYTYIPGKSDRMKAVITDHKAARLMVRYLEKPLKIRKIEFEGDRAFVELDRVRGVQQDTGSNHSSDGNVSLEDRAKNASRDVAVLPYTEENMNIERTVARGYYELVKENGSWKIAYEKLYQGIYLLGEYCDSLYGDLC